MSLFLLCLNVEHPGLVCGSRVIRKPKRFHFILAYLLPQWEAPTAWSKVTVPALAAPFFWVSRLSELITWAHLDTRKTWFRMSLCLSGFYYRGQTKKKMDTGEYQGFSATTLRGKCLMHFISRDCRFEVNHYKNFFSESLENHVFIEKSFL